MVQRYCIFFYAGRRGRDGKIMIFLIFSSDCSACSGFGLIFSILSSDRNGSDDYLLEIVIFISYPEFPGRFVATFLRF